MVAGLESIVECAVFHCLHAIFDFRVSRQHDNFGRRGNFSEVAHKLNPVCVWQMHIGNGNASLYYQQLGARLEAAQRTGTPVPVWVNPALPTESIVDRSLRPGLLALQLGLALAFGGFGGHLLVRMGRTMWVRLRAQPSG